VAELIDLLLHVDRYLLDLIANYGVWIYAILFVIVFAETGLVVTPFLPGDSLLCAVREPTAKRRESPGKNGVTTSPVSAKMIAKRIK